MLLGEGNAASVPVGVCCVLLWSVVKSLFWFWCLLVIEDPNSLRPYFETSCKGHMDLVIWLRYQLKNDIVLLQQSCVAGRHWSCSGRCEGLLARLVEKEPWGLLCVYGATVVSPSLVKHKQLLLQTLRIYWIDCLVLLKMSWHWTWCHDFCHRGNPWHARPPSAEHFAATCSTWISKFSMQTFPLEQVKRIFGCRSCTKLFDLHMCRMCHIHVQSRRKYLYLHVYIHACMPADIASVHMCSM